MNVPPTANRQFVGFGCVITRDNIPLGVNYTLSDGNVVPNTAFVLSLEKRASVGQPWEFFYIGTFPGGPIFNRRGEPVTSHNPIVIFRDGNGNPAPNLADTRVIFDVLVPLRASIVATMYEPGDIT